MSANKPLPISELVRLVGDDNIQVQNLLQNCTDLRKGKKLSTITFATDPKMVHEFIEAGIGGRSKVVGLVLWMPAEKIDEINRAHPITAT